MTLSRAFSVSDAFDRHGSELLGFAINSLRDRPLAEDCVQEAMVRAWNARDRFDPARASERTWLFAILRNVIVDAVRVRARQPVAALPDDQVDVAADVADPLERLALAEGLAKLSDEHRAVVVAIHIDGLSYADVAKASGVSAATLRTRAFYALRALRGHLTEPKDPDV